MYSYISCIARSVECDSIHRVSQKIISPEVFENFPQRLTISKRNFTRQLLVHVYTKLQNFIQLCLSLTKLCHIKCDHPVSFHISLEFWLLHFLTLHLFWTMTSLTSSSWHTFIFSPHVATRARYMPSSCVCLSVCPSVRHKSVFY